ncbi:unnamed protein product [Chrysoparadoxa australica]
MVRLQECEYARCGKVATHGWADEGQARFCHSHCTPDMINMVPRTSKQETRAGEAVPVPVPASAAGFDLENQQSSSSRMHPYPADEHEGIKDMETFTRFQDKELRSQFMTKVFGIVFVQLAVTTIIVVVCRTNPDTRLYIVRNAWVFWTAWLVSLGALLIITCAGNIRRRFPHNMLLLGVFTAAFAFLLAVLTAYYAADVIMYALIGTCAIVLFCMILAKSKIDFTAMAPVLMGLMCVLLIMIFIGIFWANNVFYIVFGAIGAILFSLFLVHDIQLIMGGKKFAIGPDEYVFAALSLYLDIVNIFQYLLILISASQN